MDAVAGEATDGTTRTHNTHASTAEPTRLDTRITRFITDLPARSDRLSQHEDQIKHSYPHQSRPLGVVEVPSPRSDLSPTHPLWQVLVEVQSWEASGSSSSRASSAPWAAAALTPSTVTVG